MGRSLKLRSLDIYEFFKRTPNFDEKEASVTGKTEQEKNTAKTLQMMLIQMQKILKYLIKIGKKWLR